MLVGTEALIDGPNSGRIAYGGPNVYEEADCFRKDLSGSVITDDALARLTAFSNVMVTDHQESLTDVAQANIAQTTIENIRKYERGSELTNAVVFKRS